MVSVHKSLKLENRSLSLNVRGFWENLDANINKNNILWIKIFWTNSIFPKATLISFEQKRSFISLYPLFYTNFTKIPNFRITFPIFFNCPRVLDYKTL